MPAVQFLKWDPVTTNFVYVPGSLEAMFQRYPHAAAVKVVSVVGPSRGGKSFLQNQFAAEQGLGAVTQHFAVGHKATPETNGLWGYLREEVPRSGRLVLHVDVEGLGDNKRTDAYDRKLMAIVVMISSSMIYNVKGTLNSNHFGILSGVASLTETVTAGCSDQVDLETFDFATCRGPMPHLWWLIRDAALQDATDCSPDEWLEGQLNISTAQDETTVEVKKNIAFYFPLRNLRRLPFPTEDIVDADMASRLPTMPASEWEPAFKNDLESFKAEVLGTTEAVHVMGKDSKCIPVDPISYPSLVVRCVETANSGSNPVMASDFPGGIFAPIVDRAKRAAEAAGWAALGDQWQSKLPMNTENLLRTQKKIGDATSAVGLQERTLLLGASAEVVSRMFFDIGVEIMTDVAAANLVASTNVCEPVATHIREAAVSCKNKLINDSKTDPEIAKNGTSLFREKCAAWGKQFEEQTEACHEDVTMPAYDQLFDELTRLATDVDRECKESDDAQKKELEQQMEAARANQAKQTENLRRLKDLSEEAHTAAIARQMQLENEKAAADALQTNIRLQQEELERRLAQMKTESAQQNDEMRAVMKEAHDTQARVVKALQDKLAADAARRATDEAEFRTKQAADNDAMMKLLHAIHSRPMPQPSCCLGANTLVSVEGKGDLPACNVATGDRVAAFDCTTQMIVWSEVYFAAVPTHDTHTITITTSNGASVEMTPDHLLIHLPVNGKGTVPEAIQAGAIRGGDSVFDRNGAVVKVTSVSLTDAAPRPIAIVLTTHGTVVAGGIVCSSYDGGHLLGTAENFDLRILYAVAPLWVSGSKFVQSYAAMCDRFVHVPCRRLLGLDEPWQLLNNLYLVVDTLPRSGISQYWINAVKWIPGTNHK